jgi:hypothetical protein
MTTCHTHTHTTGLRSERPQAPVRVCVGDCGYHAQGVCDVCGRLLLRKPARARYACVCVCACIYALFTLLMFLHCLTYDTHPCTYTQHVHAVILGLVVIVSALCLQIKQNPFENNLLNRAETVCIECAHSGCSRVKCVCMYTHVCQLHAFNYLPSHSLTLPVGIAVDVWSYLSARILHFSGP